MRVSGALRICPHNLHSPQCLELALAESPYPLGWGFLSAVSAVGLGSREIDNRRLIAFKHLSAQGENLSLPPMSERFASGQNLSKFPCGPGSLIGFDKLHIETVPIAREVVGKCHAARWGGHFSPVAETDHDIGPLFVRPVGEESAIDSERFPIAEDETR